MRRPVSKVKPLTFRKILRFQDAQIPRISFFETDYISHFVKNFSNNSNTSPYPSEIYFGALPFFPPNLDSSTIQTASENTAEQTPSLQNQDDENNSQQHFHTDLSVPKNINSNVISAAAPNNQNPIPTFPLDHNDDETAKNLFLSKSPLSQVPPASTPLPKNLSQQTTSISSPSPITSTSSAQLHPSPSHPTQRHNTPAYDSTPQVHPSRRIPTPQKHNPSTSQLRHNTPAYDSTPQKHPAPPIPTPQKHNPSTSQLRHNTPAYDSAPQVHPSRRIPTPQKHNPSTSQLRHNTPAYDSTPQVHPAPPIPTPQKHNPSTSQLRHNTPAYDSAPQKHPTPPISIPQKHNPSTSQLRHNTPAYDSTPKEPTQNLSTNPTSSVDRSLLSSPSSSQKIEKTSSQSMRSPSSQSQKQRLSLKELLDFFTNPPPKSEIKEKQEKKKKKTSKQLLQKREKPSIKFRVHRKFWDNTVKPFDESELSKERQSGSLHLSPNEEKLYSLQEHRKYQQPIKPYFLEEILPIPSSSSMKEKKICPICKGKRFIVTTQKDFTHVTLCECQTTQTCPICHGQKGYEVEKENGDVFWEVCECQEFKQNLELLNRAKIPARFARTTLSSFVIMDRSQENVLLYLVKFINTWKKKKQTSLQQLMKQSFLLMGPTGVGKTHLMVGFLRQLVLTHSLSARFLDFGDLLTTLKEQYKKGLTDTEIIQPLLSVDVLLIDDFAKGRNTQWELGIIDLLISTRYNKNKITLITTNYTNNSETTLREKYRNTSNLNFGNDYTWDTLEERVGERVYSRLLEMCQFFFITGFDFRRLNRSIALSQAFSPPSQ